MEACILICKQNKRAGRKGKILFVDAKDKVTRKNAESNLEPEHIKEILDAYLRYDYIDGFSNVATIEEIKQKGYMLAIPLYVSKNNESSYDTRSSLKKFDECSRDMHEAYQLLTQMFM